MTPYKDFLIFEVPQDVDYYDSIDVNDDGWICFTIPDGFGTKSECFDAKLPEGEYKFLFDTEDMTEDEAREIVEKDDPHPSWPHIDLWENYMKGEEYEYLNTALESFRSLLKSKGLNTTKRYLILKKKR